MTSALPHRHWFDYVFLSIRTLWFLAGVNYIVSNPGNYNHGSHLLGAAGMLGVALSFFFIIYLVPLVLYMRQRRLTVYPVIAEMALSGAFNCFFEGNSTNEFAFYNLPALAMAYMSGSRLGIGLAVSSVVATPLLASLVWGFGLESAVNIIVDGLIFLAIGYSFRKLVSSFFQIKRMNGIIGEQNRTLELYANQIEQLTLTQERSRLSRELHDTVGHTFTTTITGMDAVYYLIDADREEAKRSLRELLDVTRSGLDEVRRHIHQIAPEGEERSLTLVLSGIAREFASFTDTAVDYDAEGEEYPVPENVRTALVRCVQEALTNAKKHGFATAIRIRLTYHPDRLQLIVKDNGAGTNQLVEGFGLHAMGERISNAHGSLHVASSPGYGVTIECHIPALWRAEIRQSEGA
ncbi:sensor histidine kinase [Cohnella lubricantis]|uniref:histidine kinase n=1 Tax=Cohnella lubricantis TaxID=2163172 RepID=A0A841THE2_9BACL|nr:sensor histidine kinase [Cohnella lubricantis]MBB6677871.1 sensor histidine kinase [Cohnella lubricantis]MBP2119053.1 signal transduction histidine kinase [Cohnella lubricantis]